MFVLKQLNEGVDEMSNVDISGTHVNITNYLNKNGILSGFELF